MDAVFIVCAGASVVLGLLRPGLLCALSLHSYNYESYFGSEPLIGVVLVCVVPLVGLIYAVIKKDGGLHLIDGLFALFTLAFLVMAVRSPAPDAAGEAVAKYAATCAGMYFAPRFLFAKYREYNAFVRDFGVSFVVQALLFAAVAEAPEGIERTQIGDGNAFGFGVSLNIALAVVIGSLLSRRDWLPAERKPYHLLAVLGALAALGYATFLNGTRSALIGVFAAAVAVSSVLIWRRGAGAVPVVRLARVIAFLALVFAIVVGSAAVVTRLGPDVLSERMQYPILKLANTLLLHEAYPVRDAEGSSGRTEFYARAWEMVRKAPLAGHGLGGFTRDDSDPYRVGLSGPSHRVVENMLLELLVEGGLFVPLLLLAWIAAVVAVGLRQSGEAPGLSASRVFLTLALASFVMLQLGGTLLIAKDLFFALGTLVGAEIVRARRLHRRRPRHDRRRRPPPDAAQGAPTAGP